MKLIKWTKEEDSIIRQMRNEGFTVYAISKKLNRSQGVIENRIGKLRKEDGAYNIDHVSEKYEMNNDLFYEINPKSILDLFSGKNSFWKKYSKEATVISNDIKKDIISDIHADAEELLEVFYSIGNISFDLIDIDPFGSPIRYLDKSIMMSNKGIIITFGDIKKLKRFPTKYKSYMLDVYRIDIPISKVTLSDLENFVIERAKRLGKNLEVYAACSWKTSDRIWFKIKED